MTQATATKPLIDISKIDRAHFYPYANITQEFIAKRLAGQLGLEYCAGNSRASIERHYSDAAALFLIRELEKLLPNELDEILEIRYGSHSFTLLVQSDNLLPLIDYVNEHGNPQVVVEALAQAEKNLAEFYDKFVETFASKFGKSRSDITFSDYAGKIRFTSDGRMKDRSDNGDRIGFYLKVDPLLAEFVASSLNSRIKSSLNLSRGNDCVEIDPEYKERIFVSLDLKTVEKGIDPAKADRILDTKARGQAY